MITAIYSQQVHTHRVAQQFSGGDFAASPTKLSTTRKGRKVRFIYPRTWCGKWNILTSSPKLYTRISHPASPRRFLFFTFNHQGPSHRIFHPYFCERQIDKLIKLILCWRINFHRVLHYLILCLAYATFPETHIGNEQNAFKCSQKERDPSRRRASRSALGNLTVGHIPSGQLRSSLMRLRRDVARDLTKFVKRHKEESLIAFSRRLLPCDD